MRDGPLADLFRSTLGDEGERPAEPSVAEPPSEPEPPSERERNATSREAIEADLRSAEARLERVRDDEGELVRTLEALESELVYAKQWADRAWDRALVLLTEFEARASEAERNVARATELARRHQEQKVSERRLRSLLDRIGHYERRAAATRSAEKDVGS